MKHLRALKNFWNDDDSAPRAIAWTLSLLVVASFFFAMGIYGIYNLLNPGYLSWVLTAIIFANSVLAVLFIVHSVPLMGLSSPMMAMLVHSYGVSMPLLFLFISLYGTYKVFK